MESQNHHLRSNALNHPKQKLRSLPASPLNLLSLLVHQNPMRIASIHLELCWFLTTPRESTDQIATSPNKLSRTCLLMIPGYNKEYSLVQSSLTSAMELS